MSGSILAHPRTTNDSNMLALLHSGFYYFLFVSSPVLFPIWRVFLQPCGPVTCCCLIQNRTPINRSNHDDQRRAFHESESLDRTILVFACCMVSTGGCTFLRESATGAHQPEELKLKRLASSKGVGVLVHNRIVTGCTLHSE